MKATAKLLVAALAAAGMVSMGAEAAERRGGGIGHGASHGGGHRGHWNGGHRHWAGHRHWGGHRHWSGGWGYRSHWYGPRLGFYFGVPVAIGLGYWGSPYWDYPRETVVYREVIRDSDEETESPREAPEPEPAARTEQPAPASGPLYMNYCDSAKAYYPKVTRCPEGWKFVTPTS